MALSEKPVFTGRVSWTLRGPNGEIKAAHIGPNLVVTAGKNFLAAWLAAASQSNAFMPYIGIGDGDTAATLSDTALESQLARAAGTVSAGANILQNTITFAAGTGTGDITEVGLFSASSSGTMFARQVFSPVGKGVNDSLDVTWQITIS